MKVYETNSGGPVDEEYTYHTKEGQPLSEAVIHAVSDFTGRKMTAANNRTADELDTLYDTIDPDALDVLFQTSKDETSKVGSVEFGYSGCEVTVQSNGLVIVTKRNS